MNKDLKHFGVLGMHWGQRRGQKGTFGHKPRPQEVRKAVSTKASSLVSLAKKKYSDLPDRKKDGLKVLGLVGGTVASTYVLAKFSDKMVSSLMKSSYDASIMEIATTIIKARG